MKFISWNMAQKYDSWRLLLNMDVDLALLQEACSPPPDVAERIVSDPAIEVDSAPWETTLLGGSRAKFRTVIVKLSNRIKVDWWETKTIDTGGGLGYLLVGAPGSLAAAVVTLPSGDRLIVFSMYATAYDPFNFSDAAAHRIVSDLSAFVVGEHGYRVVAAGNLNILRGYGQFDDYPHWPARYRDYWAARYKTVFDRMEVMGLSYVGPEYPNGRQADPWADELPRNSRNVPTFRPDEQSPETATCQHDYVFASTALAGSLNVRALNDPDEWGPSNHCRIEIELGESG